MLIFFTSSYNHLFFQRIVIFSFTWFCRLFVLYSVTYQNKTFIRIFSKKNYIHYKTEYLVESVNYPILLEMYFLMLKVTKNNEFWWLLCCLRRTFFLLWIQINIDKYFLIFHNKFYHKNQVLISHWIQTKNLPSFLFEKTNAVQVNDIN